MMCKTCKTEMNYTNNKGPNMGMRMDYVGLYRCAKCASGWSLYRNADFVGARKRRQIKKYGRPRNA